LYALSAKLMVVFPCNVAVLALRGFDQFRGLDHTVSDSAFKERDPISTAKLGGFVAQLPGTGTS
jgi:hypothetical protein